MAWDQILFQGHILSMASCHRGSLITCCRRVLITCCRGALITCCWGALIICCRGAIIIYGGQRILWYVAYFVPGIQGVGGGDLLCAKVWRGNESPIFSCQLWFFLTLKTIVNISQSPLKNLLQNALTPLFFWTKLIHPPLSQQIIRYYNNL